MYAPAYAGAAVAEAKAKAKASMAKYLASLVKREEEGWTVLAAEVRRAVLLQRRCAGAGPPYPGQAQGRG